MSEYDDTWPLKNDGDVWFDEVGDRWESVGTLPGRIFEFHICIGPDLQPGGMVETTDDCAEGAKPTKITQIKRVLVRHLSGEEIEMPHNRPIVVARFFNIIRDMC